ncbi:hypothetical protein [Candidatus Uabimicrobium sp. HlEnr_7]|uniref:hypothetical protein n=1 Tax=Candidatus Uabimicrobium helgolandensis TaxID=3095367 RepID=UPI00355685F5
MWGKFTIKGSSELESKITAIMKEVVSTLKPLLPPKNYRALILIGGYGRGEGGVEIQNGVQKPHNNFDFLLLTKNLSDNQKLKNALDSAVVPLVKKYDIGMDIGMIDYQKLRRSSRLVMWHDMYFGHKVILGAEDCISSLKKFASKNIVRQDIINLLVNRGTLLLINELLLQKCSLEDEVIRRLIIKHTVKAVIGYGDALLYFRGAYSWSYAEKQRLMQSQSVDSVFKKLYDEMINFRFQPQYENYLQLDLGKWIDGLLPQLANVHLLCEQKRLKKNITWENYLQNAFTHTFSANIFSPRTTVKKFIHFTKSKPRVSFGNLFANLGYRCCDPRQILTIIFPIVAYKIYDGDARIIENILGTQDNKLLIPYLKQWSICGDSNFVHFLKRYNIELVH